MKDILIVTNSATANANNIIKFIATNASKNEGTANLTAKSTGGYIDMSLSTAGAYKITGSNQADTLIGGIGDDTIVITSAGDGDSDTIDGKTGSDTLQLASGSNVFSDNDKLKNVEIILANTGGSVANLNGQTEGFTITGQGGIDIITGGSGADIITDGSGNVNDTITGGAGNDIITIAAGTDIVKDLGGASGTDEDVVVIKANASLDAIDIIGFTATSDTKNNSTSATNATLTAKDANDVTIDVSKATEHLERLN